MAWVGRKYKLETSENFDEYMKELGQYNNTAIYLLNPFVINISFDGVATHFQR